MQTKSLALIPSTQILPLSTRQRQPTSPHIKHPTSSHIDGEIPQFRMRISERSIVRGARPGDGRGVVGLDEMQAKFGEEARWVYNVLRGIDYSEVRERVNNQTMLASKSVRPAITKPEEAMHWLGILATELAIRLREAREERTNLWPKTLVLRYIRAGSVPRSRQTAFPFTDPRNQDDLAKVILKKGQKLWEESVGDALGQGIGGTSSGGDAKVLTIALGFGNLAEGEVGQRGITGFLGAANNSSTSSLGTNTSASVPSKSVAADAADEQASPRKKKKLNRLDHLFETQSKQQQQQQRSTPPLPTSDDNREDKVDSTEEPAADPAKKTEADNGDAGSGNTNSDGEQDPRWTCPECGHAVTAPTESAWFEKPYLVEKLKDEHLDWHFAVSLSQAPQPSGSTASRPSAATNLPATQKKKRALDKFFTRR